MYGYSYLVFLRGEGKVSEAAFEWILGERMCFRVLHLPEGR